MMQGLRELWGKIQYNIKRVMDSDPAATSAVSYTHLDVYKRQPMYTLKSHI